MMAVDFDRGWHGYHGWGRGARAWLAKEGRNYRFPTGVWFVVAGAGAGASFSTLPR